jgi:flagellar M-ring protein FliF
VQSASVKLAIPTESVFTDNQKDPTASVFVRETAGTTLDANQVQAIVHLVSAGISGMKPADVAVVDANGKVLSTVGAIAGSGALADQATGEYESKVEAAVHELLDPLVGANNVTVTATALLNYDTSQKTIESYTAAPTTPPLASSTKTEEYTGTGSGSATGVLGPDNIAVPSGTSGTGDGSYKSSSQDLTNAVDKTTEVVTAAPGTLERQSVSVAINSTAGAKLDMTALQSAISASAGIDAARGDTLSVQRMPFDTTAAAQATAALAAADKQAKAEATTNLIKQGAIGAVVLLILVAFLVAGARRSRRSRREALDLGRLEAAASDHEQALLDASGDQPIAVIDTNRPPQPDPIDAKRRQVAALVDEQPGEVADLLRGWLTDSGTRR